MFVAPPALRPGSHVRVIAPSSGFDRASFEEGVTRLRARYEVSFDERIFDTRGFLAGEDGARLLELHHALLDPTIEAIVGARGGYGATRLVHRLDLGLVRRARKLLVGFSDVTALHVQWQRAKVRSLHGAMVGGLGRAESGVLERWVELAEGHTPSPLSLSTLVAGRAEGPVVGGNLAIVHALEGTPFSLSARDRVVFFEDVGEAPYRVDRMLTTLRQSGFFEGARAIVLGAFTKSTAGADGTSLETVFADRLGDLEIPVVTGAPVGHLDDPGLLPLGAMVRIEATNEGATLSFDEGVTARD